jgi:mRNA interferase MazF
MMIYKCGDVVLLPFPFTDQTTSKQRPAVVISSDWFNQNRKDVIVVAITSQVPPKLKEDELMLSPTEQSQAGLPKKSIVKVTKVVTIDQTLVKKKLGVFSKKTIKKMKKLLMKLIG